jgi:LemA protein
MKRRLTASASSFFFYPVFLSPVDPRLVMLIVVVVAILIAIGLPLAWYNKLVRLRQLIKESWGNVDVQLRRRYDLIPNLVNTVKGYAAHERETFERVIEARNRAQSNTGAVGSQSEDERRLVDATKQLFAVVEGYPQLKASQNFLALQRELVDTEDRIAAARRFYNANVRDYNVTRTTFPTMLVAGFGDFPPQDFFEVDDHTVRAVPAVSLTT